jgi:hypothetical protein
MNKIKMIIKYLNYLLRHKWYVGIECFKKGLIWRGLVHDLSKFLQANFFLMLIIFMAMIIISSVVEMRRGIINQLILMIKHLPLPGCCTRKEINNGGYYQRTKVV